MRALSYFLSILMAIYPLAPYADEITDIGLGAQQYGKELVNGFNNAPPQYSNGRVQLPTMTNGVFTNDTTIDVDTASLYPADSVTPGSPTVTDLQGVSSDGDDMDDLGTNVQSTLWDDANASSQTVVGGAYKVMIDMANTKKPDLADDPVFNTTRDIYANMDTIAADFGDCSATTEYIDTPTTKHIPDYKSCERIVDRSGACTVMHNLQTFADPIQFDEQLIQWGGSSWSATFGTQIGNYRDFRLYTNTNSTSFRSYARYRFYVSDPSKLSSVSVLGQVGMDNAGVVWLRNAEGNNVVVANNAGYSWNAGSQVYEPSSSVPSGSYNPNIRELLPYIRQGWNEIGGGLYGSARPNYIDIRIRFQVPVQVTQDTWTPENCISTAKGLYDGFANGTVACSSMMAVGGTGCTVVNNMPVCASDIQPSPFPNISAFCAQVDVNVSYDFYKGQFCYTAADGKEVCVNSGGGTLDTCAALEASGNCGFISQKCVEGASAPDGTCYVFDEVWDCGEDVQIPDSTSSTSYDCGGPIRCMGNDCMTPESTQSTSFAETAALMNAAQFMAQDMNCVEGGNCIIFGGQNQQCKIAVGGVQDCCDVPTNVTTGTYIAALMAFSKLDSGLMALENGNVVKGAYQTLREPVAKTVSNVTQPFSSYIENISSSVEEFVQPVEAFVEELKEEVKTAIQDTVQDLLGQTAEDMGADAATSAAADGTTQAVQEETTNALMENVAGAASAFMTVYTAYVVTVMVIQMVYECEQEEFELAAKKDVKSCHYVGSYCADEVLGACLEKRESYCCYNSPLSRIINEQVNPQLGVNFGSPENPSCGGLTIEQIGAVDWSQVDLGEWTALLVQNNLLPTTANITMDRLTGTGSSLNRIDGNRLDSTERAQGRLNETDVDASRKEAYDNFLANPEGN